MNTSRHSRRLHVTYAWPLVLCLVGVDYFSTLAYLPSIAVSAAGPFAPVAAGGVVAITFLLALPVYWYVVGRRPDGRGAAGLLETSIPGWRGKLLVLTLLGFAAVDFVITRRLSLADAAIHLVHNPYGRRLMEQLPVAAESDKLALCRPLSWCLTQVEDPQVVMTLILSMASVGLWQLLKHGVSRAALYVAAAAVVAYLALTGVVIIAGAGRLVSNPRILTAWLEITTGAARDATYSANGYGWLWTMAGVALWSFPQLALGLSGFEMIMTLSPRISGGVPSRFADGRIRNTRKLMLAGASIMAVYLIAAVMVTTLLVPFEAMATGGPAEHRALAYLAHCGAIAGDTDGVGLSLGRGQLFSVLFDGATVLILCLAGVSVTMSVQTLLPHYLNRLGMDVTWAGRVGGILLILHVVVLVVTIFFEANPSSLQWAYATSVLALLAGTALAALLDIYKTARRGLWRLLLLCVATAAGGLFATLAGITILINHSGLAIAAGFIAAILISSMTSRWIRSTELRFRGFRFADDSTKRRWAELRHASNVVLIPHRPGIISLAQKCDAVRQDFRLDETRRLLFVEAELGDPSNFYQEPLMSIEHEGELEVLRVSSCVSIAHVLAVIGLELCVDHGAPPEMIFGWSNERPLASNLNFLLFGEGNVPWMVNELVRRSRPRAGGQPRIVVG